MPDKQTKAEHQDDLASQDMEGATPEKLAFAVLNTKPKRDDEWKYMCKAKSAS